MLRRRHLLEYIFPKICLSCEQPGEYLCRDCKKTSEPHPELCPYCHKYSPNYKTCLNCKTDKNNVLEGCIIPFRYNKFIKKLVLHLKYYHHKDVADFLADRLVLARQTTQTNTTPNTTIISYIPSHRYRKYFIKGYNQSEILAQKLSEKLEIQLAQILRKPKATKSQTKLLRQQRLTNLEEKFKISKTCKLQGNETILLIDDITTTTSTLNQAARTIKQHYPKVKIRGMVIARHC